MTEATTQESFLEKLRLALGLVESLKSENETLKDNFEKVPKWGLTRIDFREVRSNPAQKR